MFKLFLSCSCGVYLCRMSFSAANLLLLTAWWATFSLYERSEFERIFGGLRDLLSVDVIPGFLHALSEFWVPSLSSFRMTTGELSPTLEEYHYLLGFAAVLRDYPVMGGAGPLAMAEDLFGLHRSFLLDWLTGDSLACSVTSFTDFFVREVPPSGRDHLSV